MQNYTVKSSKKPYKVHPQKSLRENVTAVLTVMYDDFISLSEKIISEKGPADIFHRMRINGKPLKYTMEIADGAFGNDFKKCFNEIKELLELMGSVHDCDVNITELEKFLNENRIFDSELKNPGKQVSTNAVDGLLSLLKEKRRELFEKFCDNIKRWENKNFRKRLISSMRNVQKTPNP